MTNLNKYIHKHSALLYLLLTLFIFIYLIIRAHEVPISHDEATNYFDWVSQPTINVLNSIGINSSNNHLLMTLLIKLSVKIFGLSELSLRIPSLILFLPYTLIAYKLSHRFGHRYTAVFCYSFLVLCPALLDFFALGRGYSLSITLILLVFYLWHKWSYLNLVRYLAIMILLSISSINLIPMVTLAIAVWLVVAIQSLNPKHSMIDYLLRQLIGLVAIWPAILMAIVLAMSGQLYWGGISGLGKDTIQSIANMLIYRSYSPEYMPLLSLFVMTVMLWIWLSSHIYLLWKYFRKRRNRQASIYPGRLTTWVALLDIILLLTALQFHLFGIRLPIERAAIHYLILLVLVCTELLDIVSPVIAKRIIWSLLILIFVQFWLTINFDRYYYWQGKDVRELCQYVSAPTKAERTVLANGLIGQSCNLYNYIRDNTNAKIIIGYTDNAQFNLLLNTIKFDYALLLSYERLPKYGKLLYQSDYFALWHNTAVTD